MTDTAPPILRTAMVARTVDDAFTIFTEEIGGWWPLPTHSVFQAEAGGVHFVDGQLIERATDGRSTVWGEVLAWEPPSRLVLSWHPGHDPDSAAAGSGRVEVTFNPSEGGTRVEIRHDGWEAFGRAAMQRRRDYTGPSAWGHVLDHFADGAEARFDPNPTDSTDQDSTDAEPAPVEAEPPSDTGAANGRDGDVDPRPDLDNLTEAYAAFFAEAEAGAANGGFTTPTDGGWTAEQVVAHVALNDLALTAVGHGLIHRGEPTFENRVCQEIENLDAVVASCGEFDRLIEYGRRCATQAMAVARRLDPDQRAHPVACTFEHDGEVVGQGPMPWGQVAIDIQAARHLPAHVEQLRNLR